MDKNTITGLVLIGLLLIGFSYFSRPSEEQLAARQHYYDSIARVQQEAEALKIKTEAALADEQKSTAANDSNALFFGALQGTPAIATLENNLVQVAFSTRGGCPQSVVIKDYMEQDRKTPITLFTEQNMSMNFNFYDKNGAIRTRDYYFRPVNQTDSTLTMRLAVDEQSYIDFIYTLKADSYLLDFKIQATGMADKLASTGYVDIDWSQRARQLEKSFTYENRLAELTYKIKGDDVENLSAAQNEEKTPEQTPLTWVAFKNQFFSSAFISDQGFHKATLRSKMEQEGSGYIKDYAAEMNTFFDPSGKQPTQMFLYLGPNHFKTLKALDAGREEKWQIHRLVYLGWPIVRLINQYITVNIFDWLTGWGLSMGIVLLIMTIIVKIVIYPTTWKTYISSAKMRVLRPKVDEINQKYPKPEDAMKKQQEIMTMYNQYGVSPMGGCLPMLLQFPILMALFMFVPSAIELRQQSFLWADDLSTYDAIINFPFHIPFLGDHLSLFCLLMTVTTLLNTKYTMNMQDTGAQPQMPMMKWMMYLMPIMLLFVLNSYPSGLNYYYFLSTLISVAVMILLRKTTDEQKLLAILEAKKKDPKQSKLTGFAARLEAINKMQQEQAQQRKKK